MEVLGFLFAWFLRLGANFVSSKVEQEGWKIKVKFITLSLIKNIMGKIMIIYPP